MRYFLLLPLIILASHTFAQVQTDDPYIWLEEVESEDALGWVEARNAETLTILEAQAEFQELYDTALGIITSDDRILGPSLIGDHIYNFWQDAENPRGIWRRTSWDAYLDGQPEWEIVLDVDQLVADEGINWAFSGSTCLQPEYRLCLIQLARGGSDAVEVREFDLTTREFVEGGFSLPESKSSLTWVDENTLVASASLDPKGETDSGYPLAARLWTRGTDFTDGDVIFEIDPQDVAIFISSASTSDGSLPVIVHMESFFTMHYHVVIDGEALPINLPTDASPSVLQDRLIVQLRSDWEMNDRTFPAGALISASLSSVLDGNPEFDLIVESEDRRVVLGATTTEDFLLVSILDNVRSEMHAYQFDGSFWTSERIQTPEFGNIGGAIRTSGSNRFFITYSDYLRPTTLYYVDGDAGTTPVAIQELEPKFNADGLTVHQYEATSADGTTIPYFIIHREDIPLDGSTPTLLYGYGGFEVPLVPGYDAITGALWLERGGAYVVANIRGGGELGPEWHRSAQRENKQRSYDDFIAVAEHLIEREITSPRHLGIYGGSNGGLLVTAVMTQRPDLFNAVISAVPLIDMKRYHLLLAGASWMAEYGNPDNPDDWAFISQYSPYQNLREDADYPAILLTTTTRDDRVHPGHARKMAAKMIDMGYDVFYFENMEGGHGAGTTPEQRALMQTVLHAYLIRQLW